jgi:hypothetical protein
MIAHVGSALQSTIDLHPPSKDRFELQDKDNETNVPDTVVGFDLGTAVQRTPN